MNIEQISQYQYDVYLNKDKVGTIIWSSMQTWDYFRIKNIPFTPTEAVELREFIDNLEA